MPDNLAEVAIAMADDQTIVTTDLEAAALHLARRIRSAEAKGEPIRLLTYRSLVIFREALRVRREDPRKRSSKTCSRDD